MPLTPEQVEEISVRAAKSAAEQAAREVVEQALERAAYEAAHKAAGAVAMDKDEMRSVVAESVHQTLVQLGIDHDDPLEMQKDFQHLRDWRQTTTAVKRKGFLTAIGLLITGLIALVWLGFQDLAASRY